MDGPADVDLLDALVRARTGGHRLGERVEVDDHELERLDAELGELLRVLGTAEVGEDPGVHPRVQGLDPAVEALGEPGEVLDLASPGRRHSAMRAAVLPGGDELDARRVQAAGELDEPGLVVDADQRATDGSTPLV